MQFKLKKIEEKANSKTFIFSSIRQISSHSFMRIAYFARSIASWHIPIWNITPYVRTCKSRFSVSSIIRKKFHLRNWCDRRIVIFNFAPNLKHNTQAEQRKHARQQRKTERKRYANRAWMNMFSLANSRNQLTNDSIRKDVYRQLQKTKLPIATASRRHNRSLRAWEDTAIPLYTCFRVPYNIQ